MKKKFSDDFIFKKNLPTNSLCKSLYTITEKIRYETLGGKMLKGIKKNFNENYSQIIELKRKDKLDNKDDVPITEAFELYMLKNFHNIKLNSLTTKMLSFWEKEFDQYISKHINFLKENLENQNIYGSHFSKILQDMDIFQTDDDEDLKEENQNESQDNPSIDNDQNENDDQKGQRKDQEAETSLDSDYDIDEYKIDEQLVDTDITTKF